MIKCKDSKVLSHLKCHLDNIERQGKNTIFFNIQTV